MSFRPIRGPGAKSQSREVQANARTDDQEQWRYSGSILKCTKCDRHRLSQQSNRDYRERNGLGQEHVRRRAVQGFPMRTTRDHKSESDRNEKSAESVIAANDPNRSIANTRESNDVGGEAAAEKVREGGAFALWVLPAQRRLSD